MANGQGTLRYTESPTLSKCMFTKAYLIVFNQIVCVDAKCTSLRILFYRSQFQWVSVLCPISFNLATVTYRTLSTQQSTYVVSLGPLDQPFPSNLFLFLFLFLGLSRILANVLVLFQQTVFRVSSTSMLLQSLVSYCLPHLRLIFLVNTLLAHQLASSNYLL